MAQTTTSYSACDAVIALDDDAGALTDISGSTNEVSLSFTVNEGTAHTFDGDFPIRKLCGKDCTGSATILMSSTADQAWDLVKGWYHVYDCAARTMRIEPQGTGSGYDRIEGEFVLQSYDFTLSSEDAGPIAVTINIAADGEIYMLEQGT